MLNFLLPILSGQKNSLCIFTSFSGHQDLSFMLLPYVTSLVLWYFLLQTSNVSQTFFNTLPDSLFCSLNHYVIFFVYSLFFLIDYWFHKSRASILFPYPSCSIDLHNASHILVLQYMLICVCAYMYVYIHIFIFIGSYYYIFIYIYK